MTRTRNKPSLGENLLTELRARLQPCRNSHCSNGALAPEVRMGIFNKLFGSQSAQAPATQPEQAVLIHLNGTDLPQSVYDDNDLMTLESQLTASLDGAGVGELDGNEIGPEGAVIYLYGSDAERLFTKIESVLRNYPLCQKARVVIRQGKPGSPQREINL